MTKKIICLFFLLFFAGCGTNNVQKFYNGNPAPLKPEDFQPWSGNVKLVQVAQSNLSKSIEQAQKKNFNYLGASSFYANAQYDPRKDILEHGSSIEADLAIWTFWYKDTQTGTAPVYAWVPGTTSQTNETGSWNSQAQGYIDGPGLNDYGVSGTGYGVYQGGSTTTTAGRTVPVGVTNYSIDRNHYEVGFYKKGVPLRLGVRFTETTEELKAKLGRNSGVIINLVVNETPAFYANLLKGDLILEINGRELTVGNFNSTIAAHAGRNAVLKIYRGGKMLTKTIKFER